MRIGLDLVEIEPLQESIRTFGNRFTDRLFTRDELDYSMQGAAVTGQRLAARFAAKEALIKALQLSEAGVRWRDIEVVKLPGGDCRMQLHGRVAELARGMGVTEVLLSLSHDGDYAAAMVSARVSTKDNQEGLQ
jgi:holo-[acyl-carrier protein] synthase